MKFENMKTCVFDIEAINLRAWPYGGLLCACIKPLGKKPKVFRIDESKNYHKKRWCDKQLAKEIRNELRKHDCMITFNGRWYDKPYLNTRLMFNNLDPLMRLYHLDYYQLLKYKTSMVWKGQKMISSMLFKETNKTAIGAVNLKAFTGHKPSMNYVVDHCKRDVSELEKIHNKANWVLPLKMARSL